MHLQNLSLPKTLNPNFSPKFPNPLLQTLIRFCPVSPSLKSPLIHSQISYPNFFHHNPNGRLDVRQFAGRSKGKLGGTSSGRIEGDAAFRREAKRNARRKSKKLAENLFYRLKNPHKNFPDNFTEEALQMIGLGYDRMVRFMEKDDPNLKHPYDWYKYGEFGPYSWRGIVLGEPIRGRFSDERVSMMGEVRDQEEWEKIEQHDMAIDFQKRLDAMDKSSGRKYFWVFVRHPKWQVTDLPWQQWTLVCEVAVEVKNNQERLDKWTLMGRLGNTARSMITKCAAWMRPDIIYVKRPVYQCRFEPQDDFFAELAPFLDLKTEGQYPCEMVKEDGSVELCTYFGGLCRILRVSSKTPFVDDVVKGFEKLSDERKSDCLEFLFGNHPVMLLHPFTKEWKAMLEEMELGCDAPDEDDGGGENEAGNEIVDWVEDDGYDENNGVDDDDDVIVDEVEEEEEGLVQKEDPNYWEEEFKKAIRSNEALEKLVEKSVETSNKYYKAQMQRKGKVENMGGGDELEMRGKRAKISAEEWKVLGYGPYRRRVKKSKIPPEMFLRAAVRPFTYRNLVKEIVLTRHAIVEGEIGGMK